MAEPGANNDGVVKKTKEELLADFTSAVLEGNTRPRPKVRPKGTFKDKEGERPPQAADEDAGFVKSGDFPKGKVF